MPSKGKDGEVVVLQGCQISVVFRQRARMPSSRPPDHLILERRKQEAARDKILEFTRNQSTCDMRMRWEKNSDRQIVLGTIERRVNEAMVKYQLSIEERRDR